MSELKPCTRHVSITNSKPVEFNSLGLQANYIEDDYIAQRIVGGQHDKTLKDTLVTFASARFWVAERSLLPCPCASGSPDNGSSRRGRWPRTFKALRIDDEVRLAVRDAFMIYINALLGVVGPDGEFDSVVLEPLVVNLRAALLGIGMLQEGTPSLADAGLVSRLVRQFAKYVLKVCAARHPGVGKPAARDKVHGNRQFRAEIDALHIPRRVDSQGRLKELFLVRHCSRCLAGLVAAFCRNRPYASLLAPRASSVRFAGLTPALDPATSRVAQGNRTLTLSQIRT